MCVYVMMKFQGKFLQQCTQLAIKALSDDDHHRDETGSVPWSDNVSVCDSVARLYADWPQMHLVWCFNTFLLQQ